MSSYSEYFEPLTDEEVDSFIEEYEKTTQTEKEIVEVEDLESAFRYREALLLKGAEAEAAIFSGEIKKLIDAYIKGNEKIAEGLKYFTDWTLYSVALRPETADTFECMPLYEDLFAAWAKAGEGVYPDLIRARLQLLHHFLVWKENGGKFDNLPEDQQVLLRDLELNLISNLENEIPALDERGEYQSAYEIKRALQRFFLYRKQPNESIRWMKETVEAIKKTPDFKETQLADLQLELGRIFYTYKKFDAALRYFEVSFALYSQAGEDWEMKMYQAEGWIEECNKQMG